MINLSIIIPVYNVEKYIHECLFSLHDQVTDDIEIIIVNDGSTDNSMQIINSFIDTFSVRKNFFVIHQKNHGVSHARNTGIKVSKGNYISFIDPDDIVSKNYIIEILNATQYSPDLIQFNAYSFFKNNPIQELVNFSTSGLYVNTDKIINEIFNKNKWFSWLRVYKKQFIIKNPFPENMTHFEDVYIVSKILTEVKNIFFINEYLYKYRVLESSSTRSLKVKKKLLNSCENLIQELIYRSNVQKVYIIPLIHFFSIYIDESIKNFGVLKVIKNWSKFSKKIMQIPCPPHIITNNKERIFLQLMPLGVISLYLAKRLNSLNNLKNKLFKAYNSKKNNSF